MRLMTQNLFFTVLLVSSLKVLSEDPYRILGISSTADTAEMTRAYRKLAMKWHPDRNSDPNAQQRFIEVRRAYEILIILDQRQRDSIDTSEFSKKLNEIKNRLDNLDKMMDRDFIRMLVDLINAHYSYKMAIRLINFNSSYWGRLTEEEKNQVLQYSISTALNKSEDEYLREKALNVLNSVQINLSLSELNQLNHLANDKQEPRVLRSLAKKIVKKATRSSNSCKQTINDIRV